MERSIVRPWWVYKGVKWDRRMFKEWTIGGGDTETVRGLPYTIQLYSKEHPELCKVRKVSAHSVTDLFLEELSKWPSRSAIFFHNLEFDLPVCWWMFREPFFTESKWNFTAEWKAKKLVAEFLFGKVNLAEITLGESHYLLLDTYAFFKSSLAELSTRFGLPAKLKKPRKLGEVYYKGEEYQRFKEYALRDAEIACALGHHIQEFHRLYDVRLSISAPQLSARIFRRRFMPEGRVLTAFPKELDECAVLSYHGGKNGLYVAPGIYQDVRLYDINSAYPYAMTRIPNFLECEYVVDERWSPGKTGNGRIGIVCLSGRVRGDRYAVVRDHAFRPIESEFENVWCTTYEAEHVAQVSDDLRVVGGIFVRECGKRIDNPLEKFAHYFYSKKSEERGPLREFYKIVLNSLYGKFIQATSNRAAPLARFKAGKWTWEEEEFVAGGLWNPLLASLVTGYVRAMLADLERRYDALHVSTDSIMVQCDVPVSKDLGALSLKARGTALLLRPKLYLLWNSENELTSFALHGYHGSLRHFVAMLRRGTRKYAHRRMHRFRESRISGAAPLTFGTFFKTINLELTEPLDIPPLTWVAPNGTIQKL